MLVVDDDDDDDMFMCLCIQLFVYISSQNNMILMRSHRRPYSAETMTLKSFIASGKLLKNRTSNLIFILYIYIVCRKTFSKTK